MADHTELMTMSEEGLTAEEVVAPSAASGHGIWFRRVGLATMGFAVVVLFALSMKQDSKPSSYSMATSDVTVLMESNAVKALGRPLTEQDKKVLHEEFKGAIAQTRNLQDAPIDAGSASPDCQKDFSGHILKAVARVGAVALKVTLSCLLPNSDKCSSAHDEADSLVQTMKDECVQEPSTDICQQSGDDMATVDVCIPKTCQNPDDLGKLALGHTSITCGGGGLAGVFNPILNSMHMPGLPR